MWCGGPSCLAHFHALSLSRWLRVACCTCVILHDCCTDIYDTRRLLHPSTYQWKLSDTYRLLTPSIWHSINAAFTLPTRHYPYLLEIPWLLHFLPDCCTYLTLFDWLPVLSDTYYFFDCIILPGSCKFFSDTIWLLNISVSHSFVYLSDAPCLLYLHIWHSFSWLLIWLTPRAVISTCTWQYLASVPSVWQFLIGMTPVWHFLTAISICLTLCCQLSFRLLLYVSNALFFL